MRNAAAMPPNPAPMTSTSLRSAEFSAMSACACLAGVMAASLAFVQRGHRFQTYLLKQLLYRRDDGAEFGWQPAGICRGVAKKAFHPPCRLGRRAGSAQFINPGFEALARTAGTSRRI